MAQPSDLSVNLSSISYQSHEILHIFLGQITIFLWFSYGFPMVFLWFSGGNHHVPDPRNAGVPRFIQSVCQVRPSRVA
jgi:hypothetical protein